MAEARGRRGRVADNEFFLDAPPALRRSHDSSLNHIKLMLAKRGLIDKDSVADLESANQGGGRNRVDTGDDQRRKGAALARAPPSTARPTEGKKQMTAEQLTKEIMESEEAKRKALAARRVEEESAKRGEEARKSKEEARKAAKRQRKIEEGSRKEEAVEIAPDGSAAEL